MQGRGLRCNSQRHFPRAVRSSHRLPFNGSRGRWLRSVFLNSKDDILALSWAPRSSTLDCHERTNAADGCGSHILLTIPLIALSAEVGLAGLWIH